MSLSLATKGIIQGRIETRGVIPLYLLEIIILAAIIRLSSQISSQIEMESLLDGNN